MEPIETVQPVNGLPETFSDTLKKGIASDQQQRDAHSLAPEGTEPVKHERPQNPHLKAYKEQQHEAEDIVKDHGRRSDQTADVPKALDDIARPEPFEPEPGFKTKEASEEHEAMKKVPAPEHPMSETSREHVRHGEQSTEAVSKHTAAEPPAAATQNVDVQKQPEHVQSQLKSQEAGVGKKQDSASEHPMSETPSEYAQRTKQTSASKGSVNEGPELKQPMSETPSESAPSTKETPASKGLVEENTTRETQQSTQDVAPAPQHTSAAARKEATEAEPQLKAPGDQQQAAGEQGDQVLSHPIEKQPTTDSDKDVVVADEPHGMAAGAVNVAKTVTGAVVDVLAPIGAITEGVFNLVTGRDPDRESDESKAE
jgi:hypothetical protein